MGRKFVVQTDYKANGKQVEKTHKKMGRSFGRFAAQMADGNSMIGRSFGKMNQAVNRGIAIALTALIASVGLATTEYIKFDNAITQTVSKFADVDIGTQKYIETSRALREETRRVAAISEFSATALAGAADKYAMAGVSSEQTLKLLAGTTDLATAANVDLVTAVDIATDSLGAFGKMTEDTIQLEKNLVDISDQMAKTTTTSNTSLTELFEAVSNGAKTFTSAGQTMSTFNAAAGILANSSIKGGEAGTALRNVMLRLSKPTDEAQKILNKLGVTTQDQSGNFRDIVDIMADFESGLEGMGSAQQTAALSTVFGARTVNSFNVLLSEGSDKLRSYREQIKNANGASKEMANAMRQSLAVQIEVLKSGLIELGFKFVEAFEKDGRGALQGVIDFIQQVDIQPLINFSNMLVKIFTFIASNWKLLVSLAVGIKAVSAAMVVLNILTSVFGMTLKATPIGKIITLIFLLATAITFLITHWDDVVNVLKIVGNWFVWLGGKIKDLAVTGFDFIITKIQEFFNWLALTGQKFTFILGPAGILITVLTEIAKNWDNIKKSFADGGFLSGILTLGKTLLSAVLAPVQGMLELLSNIPGLGDLAETGAAKIKALREGLTAPEISANGAGTPATPTPLVAGMGGNGTLDININNSAGDNAEVKKSRSMPTGTRINFTPSMGF